MIRNRGLFHAALGVGGLGDAALTADMVPSRLARADELQ